MQNSRTDDGAPKEGSSVPRKIMPGKSAAERGVKNAEALLKIAAEKQATMGQGLDDDTKKAFKTNTVNSAGLTMLKKHLLLILAMAYACVAGAVPGNGKNCDAGPKKNAPGHIKAKDVSYFKKLGLNVASLQPSKTPSRNWPRRSPEPMEMEGHGDLFDRGGVRRRLAGSDLLVDYYGIGGTSVGVMIDLPESAFSTITRYESSDSTLSCFQMSSSGRKAEYCSGTASYVFWIAQDGLYDGQYVRTWFVGSPASPLARFTMYSSGLSVFTPRGNIDAHTPLLEGTFAGLAWVERSLTDAPGGWVEVAENYARASHSTFVTGWVCDYIGSQAWNGHRGAPDLSAACATAGSFPTRQRKLIVTCVFDVLLVVDVAAEVLAVTVDFDAEVLIDNVVYQASSGEALELPITAANPQEGETALNFRLRPTGNVGPGNDIVYETYSGPENGRIWHGHTSSVTELDGTDFTGRVANLNDQVGTMEHARPAGGGNLSAAGRAAGGQTNIELGQIPPRIGQLAG